MSDDNVFMKVHGGIKVLEVEILLLIHQTDCNTFKIAKMVTLTCFLINETKTPPPRISPLISCSRFYFPMLSQVVKFFHYLHSNWWTRKPRKQLLVLFERKQSLLPFLIIKNLLHSILQVRISDRFLVALLLPHPVFIYSQKIFSSILTIIITADRLI